MPMFCESKTVFSGIAQSLLASSKVEKMVFLPRT